MRHAIADAISTIEGIKCAPYYTQTTKPGAASLLWAGRTESDDEFREGWLTQWVVRINLTADVAASERRIDELIPQLDAVLPSRALRITDLEPAEIALGGATLNALLVRITETQ
ncbi:hypothetical protein [Nocardioides yefusunii]|uniref:DUF3168 domain-containing protein n=1 Tax=Nocardioides yefusunii TaxID=2500546 RepID=A0ABW1QYR1_9ACTN|nr:hypothetical protein [Nocardioides yefusunii]